MSNSKRRSLDSIVRYEIQLIEKKGFFTPRRPADRLALIRLGFNGEGFSIDLYDKVLNIASYTDLGLCVYLEE